MRGPWKSSFILFAMAAVALACQTQDTATEQGSDTTPAVDAAAAREAIMANDEAFAQAFTDGDTAALSAQYAPEAVILPPNGARIEGATAIQEAWGTMIEEAGRPSLDLTTNDVQVAAAGDYAYGHGSYTMSGATPDGEEWSDQGKYLAVWKNIDGEWKMVVDTWNSDNPPAGMAEEPVE